MPRKQMEYIESQIQMWKEMRSKWRKIAKLSKGVVGYQIDADRDDYIVHSFLPIIVDANSSDATSFRVENKDRYCIAFLYIFYSMNV